jgi:hypothetical protein
MPSLPAPGVRVLRGLVGLRSGLRSRIRVGRVILSAFPELPGGLAKRASQAWQLLASEKQQHDREGDDEFGNTDVHDVTTSLAIRGQRVGAGLIAAVPSAGAMVWVDSLPAIGPAGEHCARGRRDRKVQVAMPPTR